MARVGTVTELKCTRCNQVKPVSEFHTQKKGKYYASQCKECANEPKRERSRQFVMLNTDAKIKEYDTKHPFKQCLRCKEIKPISNFPIDRSHPDGHHDYCSPCNRIMNREAYRRKQDSLSPEEFIDYRTSINKRRRVKNIQHKINALSHYSVKDYPICANPFGLHTEDVTDIDVLTIDHVNGGGNKHTDDKGRRIGGYNLYRILCNSDFPEGYQVLCANCQMKKAMLHKEHPSIYETS